MRIARERYWPYVFIHHLTPPMKRLIRMLSQAVFYVIAAVFAAGGFLIVENRIHRRTQDRSR